MTTALCPCCSAAAPLPATGWRRCPHCGHRWRADPPPQTANYYQSLISRNDTEALWCEDKLRERASAVRRLVGPDGSRVLEVGCAEGLLGARVKAVRPLCYDGIELSRDALAAAARLDQVFPAPAANLSAPAYDLVAAFHVLEHIADVAGELRAWLTLLKDDGHLLIEVPLRAGHRLLAHDANREHLHQFSMASMACLLEACSLDIEEISRGHRESPVYPDSLRVVARRLPSASAQSQRLLARFSECLPMPFAIYGIGGDFENYLLPLLDALPVVALLDSAAEKQGRTIAGRRIEAFDAALHGGLPLLVSSIRFAADIRRHLLSLGIAQDLIVGLEEIYDRA